MSHADLLTNHLIRHAASMPDKVAFSFLADGEACASELTYGELLARSRRVAGALVEAGLTGKAVVLFHPPGREFIIAFCGSLMAGAIAVPLQPPATRRLLDRAASVLQDCAASAVLTVSEALGSVGGMAAERNLRVIATDELEGVVDAPLPLGIAGSDPAVLQYTSGSTGQPKGVIITQGNLVANARQIAAAFGIRPDDTVVNWLPLLHDMGLVGHVVHIIHQGVTCVHMTPQAMIRKPLRWLQTISRYRANVSGGPDFAWRLLAERVAPADLVGLDLSSWRVAFSGAETVRASTLTRVATLLSPTGFRVGSFLPCYGMAESTLIISGGPNGRPPRVAAPRDGGTTATGVISCGQMAIDCAVRIVDPVTGLRRPDGHVGEIWASGPHIASGYWGREELTAATFRNRLAGDDRTWLRTGDLGFLSDSELFVSGRLKDLLIVNGRKHHPEDLEASVQAAVPACASGAAAAFQTDDDLPHLVVTVEVEERPADRLAHDQLGEAVRAAVWARHEVLVDTVLVVRAGRIPRTTSGKVRRAETRAMWQAGTLATENPHA